MKRLKIGMAVLIGAFAIPLLTAQVATFPKWRIGGGTSGKLLEVDSLGYLLINPGGTASAIADAGYNTFPKVRIAGGTSGNLAEVDSSGRLLVTQLPVVGASSGLDGFGEFLGIGTAAACSASATQAVAANNDTKGGQFLLRNQVTFNRIVTEVSTGAVGFYGVGVYNSAGSLIVETGAIASDNAQANTSTVALTTLTPGIYYLAYTVNNTTAVLRACAGTGQTGVAAKMNAIVTRHGQGTDGVDGVMPSSLLPFVGTSSHNTPMVWVERAS